MTHLEILEDCMKVVQDKIIIDGELLAPEELKKLKRLHSQLLSLALEERQEAYDKSIREFIDHMSSALPADDAVDNDEAWDKFYSTDFVITFGEKSVRLYNHADTFDAIYDILKSELA